MDKLFQTFKDQVIPSQIISRTLRKLQMTAGNITSFLKLRKYFIKHKQIKLRHVLKKLPKGQGSFISEMQTYIHSEKTCYFKAEDGCVL